MTSTAAYRAARRIESPTTPLALALDLLATNALVIAAVAWLASGIHGAAPADWLALPVGFLYCNLVEYLLHRFVMHRKRRLLGFVFERHALQHHVFYTEQDPAYDRFSDCRLVFFPAPLQISFIAAVMAAGRFALRPFVGVNAAHIFSLALLLYFLNYELFHYLYHAPESSPLLRVPGVRRLRALHTRHHDRKKMRAINFNITYPLCDLLFGTLQGRSETDDRKETLAYAQAHR